MISSLHVLSFVFLEETFTLFCDLFGGNGLLLEKYLGRNKKKLQEIRVSPRVFSEECGLYISQEPTITGSKFFPVNF